MTCAAGALPEARTAGTDDLASGQLAADRKAARHLLDCGVLAPAERGTLAACPRWQDRR